LPGPFDPRIGWPFSCRGIIQRLAKLVLESKMGTTKPAKPRENQDMAKMDPNTRVVNRAFHTSL
jgi:hypothetical protein